MRIRILLGDRRERTGNSESLLNRARDAKMLAFIVDGHPWTLVDSPGSGYMGNDTAGMQ